MARRIESQVISSPAGNLEAILEEPEDQSPVSAALVCHPHPLHGGTMHNKVVYRIARGLRRAGRVVLRFNFRGVENSDAQARSARDWLRGRYPALPLELAGFSFGARVVTRLGCAESPTRILAVGFPTTDPDVSYLESCEAEKTFIQSTHDQYAPQSDFERMLQRFSAPKRVIWIPARDHFFDGALDELEAAVFRQAAAWRPGVKPGQPGGKLVSR